LAHDDAPVGLLDHAAVAASLDTLATPFLHVLKAQEAALAGRALIADTGTVGRRATKAGPDAWLRTLVPALETAKIVRPLRVGTSARIAARLHLPQSGIDHCRPFHLLGHTAPRTFIPALHRSIVALNCTLRRRLTAFELTHRWIFAAPDLRLSAGRRPRISGLCAQRSLNGSITTRLTLAPSGRGL
jgi:hypothetical protein